MRSRCRHWIGVFAIGSLAACGGGKPGGGTPGGGTSTPTVTQVTITPAAAAVEVGASQQFTASVSGTGAFDTTVRWSVNGTASGNATAGTITDSGLYITPYPAPATVTVTATSRADATKSASATVTLAPPPPGQGPELTVDVVADRHAISPYIYGMNAYDASFVEVAAAVRLPLERWGGDQITRYNYLLDVYSPANDWYFTVDPNNNTQYPDVSDVNAVIGREHAAGVVSMVGVPLVGWTTKRESACGFSVAKYGAQKEVNPYRADCGNGVKPDGTNIIADPTDTSVPIGPEYVAGYVRYLVGRYGEARRGGVAMYSLDNEPDYWQFVHRDVHPEYPGYDDLAQAGITYASVIKQADPSALVSGPVGGGWMGFHYSPKDWRSGWNTGPDYKYWSNPVDRLAHGDVPFTEWYLQQFKAAERQTGRRLLDYLDEHGYFGLDAIEFKPAGDTANQALRLAAPRIFWDTGYRLGGDINDAPALVPRMRGWVARNYPGTKTAITEYNLGALDHVNGALAQADLLGVFGREGLDLATIWGPPKVNSPGMFAFKIFRNYDDAGGAFGDVAVRSTSGNQARLAVYAAERSRDHALTILVVNKTFGDLSATVSMVGFSGDSLASVFRYSAGTLDHIERLADLPIGRTTLTAIFPASSLTLFVIADR